MEAVELSHAGKVLVYGELLGLGILPLVGQLDELLVDGIVGLEEELATTRRLVREAALLDLAVRALATHLNQDDRRRRRRLGFSSGSRTDEGRCREEERRVFFYSYHYNSCALEKYHYNSSIPKDTTTILVLSQERHGIRKERPRAHLQAYPAAP